MKKITSFFIAIFFAGSFTVAFSCEKMELDSPELVKMQNATGLGDLYQNAIDFILEQEGPLYSFSDFEKAVLEGDAKIVESFLENNPDAAKKKISYGYGKCFSINPVKMAIHNNDAKILSLLLKNNATFKPSFVDYPSVESLATKDKWDVVSVILKNVLVDMLDKKRLAFSMASKLLLKAVLNKNISALKMLVEKHGADVNYMEKGNSSKKEGGITSLLIAAYCEEAEICAYLLEHGAILIKDEDGKTALDYVKKLKKPEFPFNILKWKKYTDDLLESVKKDRLPRRKLGIVQALVGDIARTCFHAVAENSAKDLTTIGGKRACALKTIKKIEKELMNISAGPINSKSMILENFALVKRQIENAPEASVRLYLSENNKARVAS